MGKNIIPLFVPHFVLSAIYMLFNFLLVDLIVYVIWYDITQHWPFFEGSYSSIRISERMNLNIGFSFFSGYYINLPLSSLAACVFSFGIDDDENWCMGSECVVTG